MLSESDSTPSSSVRHEIERKFLVAKLPGDFESTASKKLEQGYVSIEPDGTEVRLRSTADRFLQTVKRGRGLERVELEIELTRDQFSRLWPATDGRRIAKKRHVIAHGEHRIEVDVFEGALTGLVVAEVEFTSREQSAAFEPPAWFGEEVTEDDRYKNRRLAVDGVPAGPKE